MRSPSHTLVPAVLSLVLASGCAPKKLPAQGPGDGATSSEVPTGAMTLLQVKPLSGGTANKETVVVADLSYTIDGFQPERFFVMAQVATNQPNMTTDGAFPSSGYLNLRAPSGRATFSFPLRYVWDRPEVKHPLRVWFYLGHRTGPRTSTVIAQAGPIDYAEE